MSLMSEFKAFAMRGNVVDLAVGVVIGTAFGKIVSSFVEGVIMPGVGMITGGGKSLTESMNAWDRESWAWRARTGRDEAAAHGMTYE